MDETSIFTDRELRFLRALLANSVPFMLVGLSAATLQGAPVVTQDIDLWFKDLTHPGIQAALETVGGVYVAPQLHQPPMFAGADLELFDVVVAMHGLAGFEEEMRRTTVIRIEDLDIPVLTLPRIIASKKATNREKDRLALPVLEDTLATLQEKDSQ